MATVAAASTGSKIIVGSWPFYWMKTPSIEVSSDVTLKAFKDIAYNLLWMEAATKAPHSKKHASSDRLVIESFKDARSITIEDDATLRTFINSSSPILISINRHS